MIECGGCKQTFIRIVAHLSKNTKCAKHIDLTEFKAIWSNFSGRKRKFICDQKKKAENEEQFFQDKAAEKRKYDNKRKVENQEQYLQDRAPKKYDYDNKRKEVNKEQHLQDKASKQHEYYHKNEKSNRKAADVDDQSINLKEIDDYLDTLGKEESYYNKRLGENRVAKSSTNKADPPELSEKIEDHGQLEERFIERFFFESGTAKFEELEDGKVMCGACKNNSPE